MRLTTTGVAGSAGWESRKYQNFVGLRRRTPGINAVLGSGSGATKVIRQEGDDKPASSGRCSHPPEARYVRAPDLQGDRSGAQLDAIQGLSNKSEQLRADYQALWSEWPGSQSDDMPAAVQRMLSDKLFNAHNTEGTDKAGNQSAESLRVLDVRANTQSSTDAAPLS